MPGVPPARYAYLGPPGTFAHAALLTLPAARRGELLPFGTVPAAVDAVRRGDADGAMVPLENSVEGSVSSTLDELATGDPVHVTREVLLPVAFVLAARPGTELAGVGAVGSHPHAHAQCAHWLRAHLPGATTVPTASTAGAAAALAAGPAPFTAAIAAPLAAERYRLDVLADGLGDHPGAVTRFVLVSRPGPPVPPTGADRTTVVALIAEDRPGALLELLGEFALRGVNLSRIESRPTGSGLGRYRFSFDCDGHVADPRVGEALSALRRTCAEVRFCGSYPRAGAAGREAGRAAGRAPRPGTTDADFRDAAAWLARLRDGRPG